MPSAFDCHDMASGFDCKIRIDSHDVYGPASSASWTLDYTFSTPDPFELCEYGGDLYVACTYDTDRPVLYNRDGGSYSEFLIDSGGSYTIQNYKHPVMQPNFGGKLYLNVTYSGAFFIGRVINASAGTWLQENGEVLGAQNFRFNANYLFWARYGRASGSTWVANQAPTYNGHMHGRWTLSGLCVTRDRYYNSTGSTLPTHTAISNYALTDAYAQMACDGEHVYACGATSGMAYINTLASGWLAYTGPSVPSGTSISNLGCHYCTGVLYMARSETSDGGSTYYLKIYEYYGGVWAETHSSLETSFTGVWFQEFSGYMYVCCGKKIWRKSLA